MRIYVELPFSPRNSRYSSPSLSLSLFSLCPSLSRSPANRARNDSLRIFEISLFRNLSSLNISIPSKYYYVLSRRRISRLSIWKKRGEGKKKLSFVLPPFILSSRKRNKNRNERKRVREKLDESIVSVANQFNFSPIDDLSFVFSPPLVTVRRQMANPINPCRGLQFETRRLNN